MNVLVAQSTVADGSMLERNNPQSAAVIKNRKAFLEKHGIELAHTTRLAIYYDQTSFCKYVKIDSPQKCYAMTDKSDLRADAFIVSEPNHALFLPVADCIGAVLYDPTHHILMLSHLGRHSLEQNGGQKSVEYLQNTYNSNPSEIEVWLTAAPNKDVFPIWALDNKGMKEVTLEQLDKAGVQPKNIHDNPADTATDENYYSYTQFFNGNSPVDGDHCIVAMMTEV